MGELAEAWNESAAKGMAATFSCCPRCNESHEDESLSMVRFATAVLVGEARLTSYALCPTTGEPILFWLVDETADSGEDIYCG